jgi:methionine sulfoxide reductase heme-binding subunit
VVRRLEAWRLFGALALGITSANLYALYSYDLHTARGLESLILYTVRCALPFFVAAFIASSLRILWPSRETRWLLSNRRYFGLAFAYGMAWHLTFVGYSTFEFGNKLNPRALALDAIGAVFLLLLTLTSFQSIAGYLRPESWHRLHKIGVYVIWFLATYIYLGMARGDKDLFHAAVLGLLVLAGILRIAAWAKVNFASVKGTSSRAN